MLSTAHKLTSKVSRHLRGFTLIELLVVIGILGVLAAAALVAINPAEAQKKARDTQRLKDMATIQSIVEQYLNDNPGAFTGADNQTDTPATGANACGAAGWLGVALGGVSVCTYANVIPVDPANRNTATTDNLGADVAQDAFYYIRWSGSSYKICTYLESKSNANKLINDGEATDNHVFSVFSSDDITCPG
ncbi:hypothetical protein CMO96_04120 [Candidatus Woesebacteria bacterium]|nr:hypothetical protein [Candidatus Woesebacteria bacterium]